MNKSRDNLRAQLREMKGKVGVFNTPQKIDEKIAALEYDITHNTIDLKQENKVGMANCLGQNRNAQKSTPFCSLD